MHRLNQKNKKILKKLLNNLNPEERPAILRLKGAGGNTLPHVLAQHNGEFLEKLLQGLDPVGRQAILELKNEDEATVADWLTTP